MAKETRAKSVICTNARPTLVYEEVDKPKDFLAHLEKNMEIKILNCSFDTMQFEIKGIEPALANTFRRVLIAETPSMAIEKVYIQTNTSIMQDEVLAHRLGLIPIYADPDNFDMMAKGDKADDKNTLVFHLNVKCTKADLEKTDLTKPQFSKIIFKTIYSGSLKWQPQSDQGTLFAKDPPRVVHDDIILTKLRPGQEIMIECHVVKGIGGDHAKFSPVATAFYRMMPEITLTEEVTGDAARELKAKCPLNVFDIEDVGKNRSARAVVARPRDCSMCRECVREKAWEDRIHLGRIRNHFIFSIESAGAIPAKQIFTRSLKVFAAKCKTILDELNKTGT